MPEPNPEVTPTPDPGKPAGPPQDMWELTINGNKVVKTRAEIEAAAQKQFAGQDKFAEAENLKRQLLAEQAKVEQDAERGRLIRKALKEKDMEAYQKFLELEGYESADAQQYIAEIKAAANQSGRPGATGDSADQEHQLIQELQAELEEQRAKTTKFEEWLANQEAEKFRTDAREKVKKALDSDEVLGKIVSSTGPREQVVREMLWEEVVKQARETNSFGPQTIDNAIANVRGKVKSLGILESTRVSVPTAGPLTGVSATLNPDKPPDRVNITDDKYGQNVAERLALMIAQRDTG